MLSLPPRVDVLELFPDERAELLGLIATLGPREWARPTSCPGWSVKDVVAHLVGDDLGLLSRKRDEWSHEDRSSSESLVAFIDRRNGQWVEAARRLSPQILVDLLVFGGEECHAWFSSLDLDALGGPVSWVGPEPAPVWLDVAREYTERWHHQQQIRDGLGAPPLDAPRFLQPVLATFVRALPACLRSVSAREGTTVGLTVSGPSGGSWTVVNDTRGWTLWAGRGDALSAEVVIDQDAAWRRFTRGISLDEARDRSTLRGEPELAARVLDTVAIIV